MRAERGNAIIVDDDIVELEPRGPTSFCVNGPRNESETQAKLGFSGHWAALGGRRRSGRGVDSRESDALRVGLIRRPFEKKKKEKKKKLCAGNCERLRDGSHGEAERSSRK